MSLSTIQNLIQLSRSQWWDKRKLENLQLKRLKLIVAHAEKNSPFYRELYAQHGFKSEQLQSLDDMALVPRIDKHMIYKTGSEHMLSETAKQDALHGVQTGGSTGRSLKIYMSKSQRKRRVAAIYRTQIANGYRPWHKLLYVQPYPGGAGAIEKLGLFRSYALDIQQPPQQWIPDILAVQPDFLSGFSNSISEIAQLVSKQNQNYRPVAVLCNSENLSPNREKHIKHGLGIAPSNVYDCWEFGNVAWQCKEHDGLHVSSDLLYVEIDDAGNLLITDLYNEDMPLIRYNIGDSAQWQDGLCACGRGFPRLKNIVGKANESVLLADGSEDFCSYRIAVTLFNALPDFVELQLQQLKAGELRILLQHKAPWPEQSINDLQQQIGRDFGLSKVEIISSKDFHVTDIGKRPLFFSAIRHIK